MTAATVFWELRYRPAGSGGAWKQQRFPVTAGLVLSAMPRDTAFQAQVRAVAASGKCSAWVDCDFVVGATNRTGALALPGNYGINQSGMWDVDTSVTYAASSTEEGVSTATISMSAGTFILAGNRIEYGATSATIDGVAGETATIYLYLYDPNREGGNKPLQLTTNYIETADEDGKVAVTSLEVTFPAAGGSGTGGGGIGGGGGSGGAGPCPWVMSWVVERDRGLIPAGEVSPDDWLLAPGGIFRRVKYSQRRTVPGVRIVTEQLHALTCSTTAPILTDRDFVMAPAVMGRTVAINGDRPELMVDVAHLGDIEVQHITLDVEHDDERVFLVGDDPAHLFPHHNLKQVDTGL